MTAVPVVPIPDDVDRAFLALVLGVEVSSIRLFARDGMPKSSRGRFPLAECVQWYVAREVAAARASKGLNELDLARQRKVVAEAKIAELGLLERQGLTVSIELHAQRLRERLETVAGNLKALGRYQPDVKAAVTDEAADALLERMTDDILSELFESNNEIG